MSDLIFEWDETKSQSNLKKHKVSFNEAKTVFSDELARLIPDPDHSIDEERFILLGASTQLRLLVVCHCEKIDGAVRIISARKADTHERKQYEGYVHARKL
ncbi:MAG: BrnT family toxin [Spongiibacteraceae bacterium]